jgi:hypothetical protein
MGLFSALISTAINVATLPVAMTLDAITLGDYDGEEEGTFTTRKMQQIIGEEK